MKATKLVMITALVSFALMSFANTEFGMSKNVISLKTALQSPKLVGAIYSQVFPADIFNSDRAGSYTAQVMLQKTVYLITGTISEWNYFFRDIDGIHSLCRNQKKPVILDEEDPLRVVTNPFGTGGALENPFSTSGVRNTGYDDKDPFGKKRKKPIQGKKAIKVLLDKH
jgi:hypothetical protein